MSAQKIQAVERQSARNRSGSGWVPNGRLQGELLERAVGSDETVHRTLEEVLSLQRSSGRTRVRMLRIARTLADLEACEALSADHILEAARLRGFAQRPSP